MRKLSREQAMAAGLLGVFVVVCLGLVGWSFTVRVAAARELAERQDVLARLEAGVRSKGGAHGPAGRAKAPAAAFVDAPTLGLASAALEAHVTQLAGHHATLVSFAVQSGSSADAGEAVHIEASMDVGQRALQSLLYELETGTPYVFVESMTVRPASAAAQAGAADPALRVTLGLRALWRHNRV